MNRISKLLVVDDESVICEGCRRVLTGQGFRVETSSDPGEGLGLACAQDYDAVLLDVKMPRMDGIEFLRQFRARKPDVPVVLITGYPSVSDAAAAMRLGAADYVTKPFTPDEITRAVRKSLRYGDDAAKEEPPLAPSGAPPWKTPASDLRFVGPSWLEMGTGALRVGALLAPSEGAPVETLCLPREGDVVYQGLPLAGLVVAGKPKGTLPSPVSGVVVAVNTGLAQGLSALWEDPFRQGWIATIAPTWLEDEAARCKPRRVILASADRASASDQCERLTALGCQVRVVSGWEELAPTLPDPDCRVLMADADSLGDQGPELARRAKQAAPSMRVVAMSCASSPWEPAYRRHGIFYYSVAPFADHEILEVLSAAFRAHQGPPSTDDRGEALAESVNSIFITSRHGKQVGLFVAGGLLSKEDGVGWYVKHKLLDRLYPMRTTAGLGQISQVKILLAASMCDRLLVLLPRDMGRLPGSLLRDTKGDFVFLPDRNTEDAEKVLALVVQPASPGAGLTGLDNATGAALAEHVVREMESC